MSTADQTAKKSDRELIYQLEGKPNFRTAFPLGLQHVLAMFTGNLAPILIIAGACKLSPEDTIVMVQCAMFVSGLTTFIQLYPIKIGKFRIGGGLPIVMGTSFAFVGTAQTYAGTAGIGGILGGTLLGSLVEVVMGIFFKPLKKLFPPLVIGSVLVTIGLHLLPVGVGYFAGGFGSPDFGSPKNLLVGFLVFFIVIGLQRFGKGMFKISAILIGLVIGYLVAIPLGMVNLGAVASSDWVSLPQPFYFDLTFSLPVILSFATIYIVSGLETIGNTNGITIAAFNREATAEETSGSIIADALGSATAAVFNALPNTAFGQNAGIVSMTKVVNKWCIAMGAFTLMVAGLFPKFGAIFAAIPASVLGGAVITVFAMIFINGIKMIAKSGFSERNVLVLGITFGLGYAFGGNVDLFLPLVELIHQTANSWSEVVPFIPQLLHIPAWIISFVFADQIACVCIISIIANFVFPMKDKEDQDKAREAIQDM